MAPATMTTNTHIHTRISLSLSLPSLSLFLSILSIWWADVSIHPSTQPSSVLAIGIFFPFFSGSFSLSVELLSYFFFLSSFSAVVWLLYLGASEREEKRLVEQFQMCVKSYCQTCTVLKIQMCICIYINIHRIVDSLRRKEECSGAPQFGGCWGGWRAADRLATTKASKLRLCERQKRRLSIRFQDLSLGEFVFCFESLYLARQSHDARQNWSFEDCWFRLFCFLNQLVVTV